MENGQGLIFIAPPIHYGCIYMTTSKNLLQGTPAANKAGLEMMSRLLEMFCKISSSNFMGLVKSGSESWMLKAAPANDFPNPASFELLLSGGSLNCRCIPVGLPDGHPFGTLCIYSTCKEQSSEQFAPFADQLAFHLNNYLELDVVRKELEIKQIEILHLEQENSQYKHITRHTLREPLRKIQLFANMLNEEIGTGNFSKAAELSVKVESFARQFSSFIEDISKFADLKPAAIKFENVDLNEIVLLVCSQLGQQLREKEAWVEKDALPVITAVPVLITQLFLELIRNALWFSRRDVAPVITISSAKEKNSSEACLMTNGEDFVTIRISDNGIGIEDYHLSKIFDVFERFHHDRELPGRGIGLSYCRKIVHHHGGTIIASSEIGKGTTFVISLPKKRL